MVRFVFRYRGVTRWTGRNETLINMEERANVLLFDVGNLVLLSTVNLPKHVVTNVGSSKLLPKYIGLFRLLRRKGNAYTIELPRRMRTHPTLYVGRLRPYHQHEVSSSG